MTGLEKICKDIRAESDETVAAILKEAEDKASAIRKEAADKTEDTCSKIRTRSEKDAGAIKARANSAAELLHRRKILEAKQEIIADVIGKAKAEAASMPQDQYFELIKKMACENAHKGEGVICFGRRDLDRLPAFFEMKLNAALPSGSRLAISKEPCDVSDGFILKYGGIEENCTFEAVFSEKKEEIQDKVREILFA